MQDLKKRMEAAVNEPDKDKQREMVQQIVDSPEMLQFKEMIQNVFNRICEIITDFIETLCEVLKPIVRVVKKYQRINSFRRQRIQHKGGMILMNNHKKKKLKKRLARRAKEVDKYQVNNAWRNIFVQAGIIK